MPIKLSKPALAALGLLRGLTGGGDGLDLSSGARYEDLIEAGEQFYDDTLKQITDARDKIRTDTISAVRKVLDDVGVPTKHEIEELRRKVDKAADGE